MRRRQLERVVTLVMAMAVAALVLAPGTAQAAGAAVTQASNDSVLRGFDGWPTGAMAIRAKTGQQWFKVLVADTPDRQERGLMFVTQLPSDVGMVFPQSPPRVVTMWMENTLIPLDMLFLGPNHRVLYIRENAPIQSRDIISTPQATWAVLEIVGGESARRGIHVGDRFSVTGIATLK